MDSAIKIYPFFHRNDYQKAWLVRILTVKDVYEDAGLRSICWNAVVPSGLLLRPKMILSMTQSYEVEK